MLTRKRVGPGQGPAGGATVGSTVCLLTELTPRIVRILIAYSPKRLTCNDFCDLLGIHDGRRIYDVLDVLCALGCVSRRGAHLYKWLGHPTLDHLPPMKDMTGRNSCITIGNAAQAVVCYFTQNESARKRIWKGVQLRTAMQWKTRIRVIYDVLSVFRGIGLISARPQEGTCCFEWTPHCMFPLVTPEEPPKESADLTKPLAFENGEDDTRSALGISFDAAPAGHPLEFEALLGPVDSPFGL